MKRMKLWLCCGLMLVLLGGCGDDAKTPDGSGQGQSPEQNITGEGQENDDRTENGGDQENNNTPEDSDKTENVDTPEINVPEVHYEAIPEHWKSKDSKGILWQVPNTEAEELGLFEVYNVGENLYICRLRWNAFEFVKMDYVDGTILQKTTVDLNEYSLVQTLKNGFVIHCSQNGKIVVLDADLQVVNEFKTNAANGSWYFGKDGSILYNFSYEGTFSCTDLYTEETNVLIENMWNCNVIGSNENYVNFFYTDLVEHIINYLCLDLQTGQLETIPFKEEMIELYRKDIVWLGRCLNSEELYKICNDKQEINIIWNSKDSFHKKRFLMSGQKHILTIDSGKMTLHDYQGNFISECQMPDNYSINVPLFEPENCFMWDEIHGGYYFLCDYTPEVNQLQRIFFWDIHAKVDGDDLVMEVVDYDTSDPVGKIVDAQLYKRAKELSEKYHLDIRIAELAYSAFEDYFGLHGQEILDEEKITEELDLIEEIMEQYGSDYMEEKILYAAYGNVEIHLLKELELVWGVQEAGPIEVYTEKINFDLDTMQRGRLILYIDVEHATEEDYKEAFYRLEQRKENWEYNYGR